MLGLCRGLRLMGGGDEGGEDKGLSSAVMGVTDREVVVLL
jgi:hypothetical protein